MLTTQGLSQTTLYFTEDDPPLPLAQNFTLVDFDSSCNYSNAVTVTVNDVADGTLESFTFNETLGVTIEQTQSPSEANSFVAEYKLRNGATYSDYEQVW